MSDGTSIIVKNYVFKAALKTITFSDFVPSLAGIKLITNVVTGTIIYQFNDVTKGGTLSGNTLTLTYDTSAMSNSDTLMIIYEEPATESVAGQILEQLEILNSEDPSDVERDDRESEIHDLIEDRLPRLGQNSVRMSVPVAIAPDSLPLAAKVATRVFTATGQTLVLDGLEGYHSVSIDIGDAVLSQTTGVDILYRGDTWQVFPFYNTINATLLVGTTTSLPIRATGSITGATAIRVVCTSYGGSLNKVTLKAYQTPSSTTQIAGGALGTIAAVTNVATIGTSVVPGTAATNLGKAIGGTPGATDTGVAALMRRINTPVAAYGTTALWNVPTVSDFGTQWATLTPSTGGGSLFAKVLSGATTNATLVKNAAAVVYGWSFSNTAATHVFVKLFNKASAPTVGTDIPALTICVPKDSQVSVDFPNGIAWATGLAYAITNLGTDADATAVLATQVLGTISYI